MTDPHFRGRPSFLAGARFRFGSHLATHTNSLALASRRKMQHWLNRLDSTLAGVHFGGPTLSCHTCLFPPSFRVFSHPSRGPFQHSLALLIRYRSSAPYLDLGVGPPIFPPSSRRTVLFMDHSSPLRIRDYHPLWYGFPSNFCSRKGYSPPHLLHVTVEYSARSSRLSFAITNRIPIGFFSARY